MAKKKSAKWPWIVGGVIVGGAILIPVVFALIGAKIFKDAEKNMQQPVVLPPAGVTGVRRWRV